METSPCDPRLVVAVDGPSGAGKSTVARGVATRLGLRYLDTGALYRAVTWLVLREGIEPDDEPAVRRLADSARLDVDTDPISPAVRIAGVDVTAAVRSPEVSAHVSAVAAQAAVRAQLLRVQHAVIGEGGIVVEGRDIGTTVAPDAGVKIFLTASADARAARRHRQPGEAAGGVDATRNELERRDAHDSGRAASPFRKADDAIEVDSTELSIDAVVDLIVARCRVRVKTS